MTINDKELLTKANIIIDLKKHYVGQIKTYSLGLIIITLFFMFLLVIASDLGFDTPVILCIMFFVFLYALFGTMSTYYIYNYFSTTKNFKVECDKLVNKKIVIRIHNRHIDTYTYFYFSHRRRYQIIPSITFSPGSCDFYTWSRYNQMNKKELYKSSNPGDEAYLITHKGKIIYVYFTKFFKASKELEEML